MSRILIAAIAALVLAAPATAADSSGTKLRGTVAQKLGANSLIRVDSRRNAHFLRIPGSQARIRVGQRVDLRGSTLRQRGNGSRVLARNVVVVRSVATTSAASSGTRASGSDDKSGRDDGPNDDNSGPGKADDDDDDDDNSGPGKGDDDDNSDDDSSDDDDTRDDTDDDDSTDDD